MRRITSVQIIKVTAAVNIVTILIILWTRAASFRPSNLQPLAQRQLRDSSPFLQLPSVCWRTECTAASYLEQLRTGDGNGYPIPALRHLVWRNESVSRYFATHLRSWRAVHPNWTLVLWRDQDLEPFVARHYPGLLDKFASLNSPIMKFDMIRYLLLFKYGGVYADLDYTLVSSLDEYRRYPAVVTREPDAHSLIYFGASWPLKPMANPAFLMSAPGHAFFHYAMAQLKSRNSSEPLWFAGPLGLTQIMDEYQATFPTVNNAMEAVFVPPSNSFYPYPDNRLNSSKSSYFSYRHFGVTYQCQIRQTDNNNLPGAEQLRRYCSDVNNMDPITDRHQPIIAIHDLDKTGGSWDGLGHDSYDRQLTDMRLIFPDLIYGFELGKV